MAENVQGCGLHEGNNKPT